MGKGTFNISQFGEIKQVTIAGMDLFPFSVQYQNDSYYNIEKRYVQLNITTYRLKNQYTTIFALLSHQLRRKTRHKIETAAQQKAAKYKKREEYEELMVDKEYLRYSYQNKFKLNPKNLLYFSIDCK